LARHPLDGYLSVPADRAFTLMHRSSMPAYLQIDDLLDLIPEPNGGRCRQMLADHRDFFEEAPGSRRNHQAWRGGYLGHLEDAMNLALVQYEAMNSLRPLPFTPADMLLVLWLHDVEKPWKYVSMDGAAVRLILSQGEVHADAETVEEMLSSKDGRAAFRNGLIRAYGIELSDEQANGLKYVEGEGDDYSPDGPVMGPLAALCHACDVLSARMWPDYPSTEDDPWLTGAGVVGRPLTGGEFAEACRSGRPVRYVETENGVVLMDCLSIPSRNPEGGYYVGGSVFDPRLFGVRDRVAQAVDDGAAALYAVPGVQYLD
jgi:hypothetical protein